MEREFRLLWHFIWALCHQAFPWRKEGPREEPAGRVHSRDGVSVSVQVCGMEPKLAQPGSWCRHCAKSGLEANPAPSSSLTSSHLEIGCSGTGGWGGQSCPIKVPQHAHSWGACGPEAMQDCGNCSILRLCCLDFSPPLSLPPSPTLGSLTLAWLLSFSGSHCKMGPHKGISLLKLM